METALATLRTERVALRPMTERDVDALFAVFSNPEVMRYWSRPPMERREEAAELLQSIRENAEAGTLYQWGVVLAEDEGTVVGTCTLARIDRSNRRAELGYALGREHWGRGYMHEALGALLDHAFGGMNMHRLEADADPRNAASTRALERLGFRLEGTLRERWIVAGEISDTAFYGLLAREWLGRDRGRP